MIKWVVQKFFPHSELPNIRIFYLLSILMNAWFALPNWAFLMSKYITKSQIGFLDAAAILLGILLEIPSGLISDVFGKKRTLIFGNLCIGLGAILLGISKTFPEFLFWNCVVLAGFAFNSGSFEAFAYDSLVEKGMQKDYDQVVAKSTSLGIGMALTSTFLGGLLFSIDARLPLVVAGVFFVTASFVLLFSTEPSIDSEQVTLQSSLNKLKDGISTIFSLRFRDILVPILVIASLAKAHQGVVRQSMADYYSFNGETFAYVLALTMLPVFFIAAKFHKILKKLGTQKLMLSILTGYTAIFLFGTLTHGVVPGILYFIFLMIGEKIAYQTMTVSANERIASTHRATALSVLALISQFPYVVLMFFFANWTEPTKIPYLILSFALIAAVTSLHTLTLHGKKQKA